MILVLCTSSILQAQESSTKRVESCESLSTGPLNLTGNIDFHVNSSAEPPLGAEIRLASPDACLFLDNVRPSRAQASFLPRIRVDGIPASLTSNCRVVQCGVGSVIIPQGPDFAPMTVFERANLSSSSARLSCYVKYGEAGEAGLNPSIWSFRLKRGYMATLAEKEDGTGVSQNYVAQDRDLLVGSLPVGLRGNVHFIRIFPWRWPTKKGVAGGIYQNLNVGWYYDWSISHKSTLDLEYVPIKQGRDWPGLASQDWQALGSTTLLGYNEPNHKDQANMTVAAALAGWPALMSTGLRLGSPAVADDGLNWLYDFIEKADKANLRVDFVAVHYYRAYENPADPRGAADQFYRFIKEIHQRTHRNVWITEFNNGANWTKHTPTYQQERSTIAAMLRMLDQTPFVERYAIYNWVEDVRMMQRKDGSLTGAGEVYRDDASPLSLIPLSQR
jgi:hypothetical protein